MELLAREDYAVHRLAAHREPDGRIVREEQLRLKVEDVRKARSVPPDEGAVGDVHLVAALVAQAAHLREHGAAEAVHVPSHKRRERRVELKRLLLALGRGARWLHVRDVHGLRGVAV